MELYVKEVTLSDKKYTIKCLCVEVGGVEVTLGYLDRFNNLVVKK